MLKLARAGIAGALFFAALAAGGTFLLNPRFVDDLQAGAVLFLLLPIAGGALIGVVAGRGLERLARIGSSEAPERALEWLWGTVTGFAVFPAALALLPAYIGIFSASETVRYGGALVLAIGLAFLGAYTVWYVANRFRFWIWPVLLALPVAIVLSGTEWGRGKAPGSRLLVVALPGLSWPIVEDLVERGEMPNLDRIRREGAWGEPRSIRPLMTPVVWTSIATGKPSEQHGVQGFHATSEDVRAARIWDIYERRGWTVGLFGWPATWPPREIDGFIVPAVSDAGTETWPAQLNFIRELAMSEKTRRQRTWGRYARYAFLGIRWGARLSTLTQAGREIVADAFLGNSLDAARLFTKRKLRAQLNCDYFTELRRQIPVDFAAYHTNIVSVAQAYFWKYHEPAAFDGISPEDIARYGESVHDAYRIVDAFLGRILADTEPNDLVVVVSDHGAEAISDASRRTLSLRIETMLTEARLKGAVEATNLGARTYLRMNEGHEASRDRVRRLFETARLARGDERAFTARVDEWGNVIVTVRPEVADHLNDTVLFQGGRAPLRDLVRTAELQESAQMSESAALVLAGRGVVPGRRLDGASLLDLVPTLLVLTGLELAADLPGDVMAQALDEPTRRRPPGMVATYDRPAPAPGS